MKKRCRRTKSSGTTEDGGDSTMYVPEDLVIEILKRLPVKSLCRFSCVSTRWRSLISDPRFIDSHLAHSATRSKLIISFADPHDDLRGGLWFFSVDQPEPWDERPQIARPQLFLPGWTGPRVSQSHDGLVCLKVGSSVKICNPSNGKHGTFQLPRPFTRSGPSFNQSYFFGFDPVERKHKVLSSHLIRIRGGLDRGFAMELRVLTLGTNKWRRIEGCAPHVKKDHEFCFGGVVYYTAWNCSQGFGGDSYLVAFDVRSESFRMIVIPARAREVRHRALLIQFEGRIAMMDCYNALCGDLIVMWILEDFDREIWKKRVFVLPPCWKEIVADSRVFPAGTVRSGELLFAPRTFSKPVCVFYYNLKTNGFRRSEICGLPEHEFFASPKECVFSDHVESLLPVRGVSTRNMPANSFFRPESSIYAPINSGVCAQAAYGNCSEVGR